MMNCRLKTPIALFAYNRPRHVALVLDTLLHCTRFGECDLHIFCDGAKHPNQSGVVAATRSVVHEFARLCNARVIEREINFGLSQSIVTGVSELCATYGRVIVVEDDFALRSDFLDYMLQGLERYANCRNVYQISGYMFPVEHPSKPDAFFLPLTTTWGWATWARAWREFDGMAKGALEMLADPLVQKHFDLDGAYPYTRMLKKRLQGQNDSWGILWWWSVFLSGGIVLHPSKSLVRVGGFDGTGTHCGVDSSQKSFDNRLIEGRALGESIAFPSDMIIDDNAFSRVKKYLRSNNPKGLSLFAFRIRKKLSVLKSVMKTRN